MRKYITYTRKKENDNFYSDPNTNNRVEEETNWVTKFFETAYDHNWVFLAYVEYPDATTPDEISYFQNLDPEFNFTFITEAEANTHLSSIWDITVKDFVFEDNRPLDLI